MLLSGGVDSTVCAALLHKALTKEQVIAVHIDNGFMRKNESQTVVQSLNKLGLNVKGKRKKRMYWYMFAVCDFELFLYRLCLESSFEIKYRSSLFCLQCLAKVHPRIYLTTICTIFSKNSTFCQPH